MKAKNEFETLQEALDSERVTAGILAMMGKDGFQMGIRGKGAGIIALMCTVAKTVAEDMGLSMAEFLTVFNELIKETEDELKRQEAVETAKEIMEEAEAGEQ